MVLLHPPIAPWVQAADDGLHLTLLARDLGAAATVEMRVLRDNEEYLVAMAPAGHDGGWTHCRATVPWCDSSPATRYAFRATDEGRCTWLGSAGPRPRVPRVEEHFRAARRSIVPAWAADQVVYEIFPDRFARGTDGPAAVPAVVHGSRPTPTQVRAWGEPLGDGEPAAVFYGGDLAGIERHLSYLNEHVGATALYLTPVFAAGSNHRYNTEDYTRVCPLLGGDAALVSLARALHARGMKLVLDAVLNHTGTNHPWFDRWGLHPTPGAAQSPDSPYARWYARDAQGRVVGWKGHASLPVLDYANPEVMQAMVEGEGAVLRRWLREPVRADGWRLDAVHMMGEGTGAAGNAALVRRIRDAAKGERADAWIVGEHFAQADAWLQGDQEDAAMNYWGFTQPLWAWLARTDFAGRPAGIDTPTFAGWLIEALAAVPYEVALAQWNPLDSHDTPRLLSALGGDVPRLAAAFALQFAWPGVPCIYYGDEVGLEGGGDPDCRRCFPWDEARWNRPLLDHVRRLAALRAAREELRRGALQVLAQGDDWLAVARHGARALAVAVVARAAVPGGLAVPLDALPFDPAGIDWTALDPGVTVGAGTLHADLPRAGAAFAFAAAR